MGKKSGSGSGKKFPSAASSASSASSPSAAAGAGAALVAVLLAAGGAQLTGLLGGGGPAGLSGPAELQCGPPGAEHFSEQPATGLHVVQVAPGAICEDGAATFTARVHVDGCHTPSWDRGAPVVWAAGDVVDVDTEDGWERGATIKGPAKSGSQAERLLEFADGTVDDWDTADFVRAGGSYGTPIELACDAPRCGALLRPLAACPPNCPLARTTLTRTFLLPAASQRRQDGGRGLANGADPSHRPGRPARPPPAAGARRPSHRGCGAVGAFRDGHQPQSAESVRRISIHFPVDFLAHNSVYQICSSSSSSSDGRRLRPTAPPSRLRSVRLQKQHFFITPFLVLIHHSSFLTQDFSFLMQNSSFLLA